MDGASTEPIIRRISPDEWRQVSENAHLICFNEKRDSLLDRIDFALLAEYKGRPSGYCTIRELDGDSVYMQYGGAFPNIKGSVLSLTTYFYFIDWCLEKYKRITTYIQNTNIVMIKMALRAGFLIIGTRFFRGDIMVEFLLENRK